MSISAFPIRLKSFSVQLEAKIVLNTLIYLYLLIFSNVRVSVMSTFLDLKPKMQKILCYDLHEILFSWNIYHAYV